MIDDVNPRLNSQVLLAVSWLLFSVPGLGASSPEQNLQPPAIKELLKANVFARLSDDREVMVHAALDGPGSGSKPGSGPASRHYSFYGAMTVRASLAQTRKILLDFPLYARMIPYVEQVKYEPARNELTLHGGIWKFQLHSRIRFEQRGERHLKYQITSGHFTGLSGEMIFEEKGENRTLVYFSGALAGIGWPPKLVIERGAEIVFGFTGRRMRNYIESESKHSIEAVTSRSTQGESDDNDPPKPRSGARHERGKPFR